jgi:transcriptional regulator with XRE-family HTH domain
MTQTVTQGANIPADTFEARLMLARLHAGRLSIRKAADRCGFGHESWSGWERGRLPQDKAEVARVVSERLGVDLDWLLWGGQLAPEVRRRRARKPTHTKLLTTIGHGRLSPRTDTGDVSIRRTGRRLAAGRPMVRHAA